MHAMAMVASQVQLAVGPRDTVVFVSFTKPAMACALVCRFCLASCTECIHECMCVQVGESLSMEDDAPGSALWLQWKAAA
jgi:hypothetical protein